MTDLKEVLAVIPPSQVVTLDLWRNGRQETMRVVLGQEPAETAGREPTRLLLGLAVEGVTPEVGVVVAGVRPGSPAAKAGVRRGDVVRELDRRLIRNLADFDEASAGVESGQSVALLVQRARTPFYLVLTPDSLNRPASAKVDASPRAA